MEKSPEKIKFGYCIICKNSTAIDEIGLCGVCASKSSESTEQLKEIFGMFNNKED